MVFLVQVIYARKYVYLLEPVKFIFIVLFSSCLMGIIVYNFKITCGSVFCRLAIKVVTGIVIYILSFLLSAKVTKNKLATDILNTCKISVKF